MSGAHEATVLETAGAVAARLGLSPSTLRAWNHRYGIGPREHVSGRYRYYGPDDVAEVAHMQRLIAQGRPAVVAAGVARARRGDPTEPGDRAHTRRTVQGAVMKLNFAAVIEALTWSVDHEGALAAWHRLYRPIMTAIGRRVFDHGDCLEHERLLSWAMTAALQRVPRPTGPGAARIYLACAPGEAHSVGLEVLRAALAERGIPADMLGTAVPSSALAEAVRRTGAAAVVVCAQTPATARIAALRPLLAHTGRVVAAGPGWEGKALPPAVTRATTLEHAIALLESRLHNGE